MKVVTFGEIMLRLAPEGYLRFTQAEKFGAVYGGGEANVSVSLANYGIDSAFVTKLPKHEIGQAAVNSLRKFGVDTSMIVMVINPTFSMTPYSNQPELDFKSYSMYWSSV